MVLFLVLLLSSVGLFYASSYEKDGRTLVNMPPKKTPPIKIKKLPNSFEAKKKCVHEECLNLMRRNSLNQEIKRKKRHKQKDKKINDVSVQGTAVLSDLVKNTVKEGEKDAVQNDLKLNDANNTSDDEIFEMEL